MDISGEICVITGASSGLGLATAKRFAALSAHVVLVCRNQQKGEQALFEVQQETPNASVELMLCDLSSMNACGRRRCRCWMNEPCRCSEKSYGERTLRGS